MPTDPGGQGAHADFLGIRFDDLSLDDALGRLALVSGDSPYHYLVTPNVDHIVRLEGEPDDGGEVRRAYDLARFRLCDSKVLAFLAAACGVRLPVVPGSELTARLFRSVIQAGDVVTIVGADAALVERMRRLFPGVAFRHHQPPMGLRRDQAALARAAAFVAEAPARFIFLAVGSPQQELLARRILEEPGARGCALCIGAGLEFASGQRKRAPRILQRMGLEWSHRLFQDPRRLWRRYLIDGPRIFPLVVRWRRDRRRAV